MNKNSAEEKSESKEIVQGLNKILKATIVINPELKIFASKKDKSEKYTEKRIFEYIVEQTKHLEGNEELRRLTSKNQYASSFPGKEFLLERIKGYKRLR